MLCHVDAGTGRELRPARRWRGSHFSPSRERDCPIRVPHRETLRPFLVSCALSAGGRREDVEEPGKLLHASRSRAQGAQAVIDPLPARLGSLSESAELHVRRPAASGGLGGALTEFSIAIDRGELWR